MKKSKIQINNFNCLWESKLLVEQFDDVLKMVHKELDKLQFKEKGIGHVQLNFTHNIYRKRFESKNKVFFDAGFCFDEYRIWMYVDLILPRKKYNRKSVELIASLLKSYEINDKHKGSHYQIVAVEVLQEINPIDKKRIKTWFKKIIAEVKAEERKITAIINNNDY